MQGGTAVQTGTGGGGGVASRAQFFMQKQQDHVGSSSGTPPASPGPTARPLPTPKQTPTPVKDDTPIATPATTTPATTTPATAAPATITPPTAVKPALRSSLHARPQRSPPPGPTPSTPTATTTTNTPAATTTNGTSHEDNNDNKAAAALDGPVTSPRGSPGHVKRRSVGAVTSNIARPLPKPASKTGAPAVSQEAPAPATSPRSPGPQPSTHARTPKPVGSPSTPVPGSPATEPRSAADPRATHSPSSSPGLRVTKLRPVSERPPIPKGTLPPRPQTQKFPVPETPQTNTAEPLPPMTAPLPPAPTAEATATDGPAADTSAVEKKDVPAKDTAKMARLRIKVIEELVETERVYIKDLEVLIKIFLFPLQAMSLLPDQGVSTIFSNVEILLNVNKEFLLNLDARISEYAKDDSNLPLGDVFRKMGDYFKMYTTYCANHPIAVSTVAKLEESNSEFQHYLRICHTDKEVEGRRIYDFLIKPVQRLCKYPLLIRELLRNTEDTHPDYDVLIGAQKKIDEVVDYINERKRNAEGNQQVFDIQIQTDGIHLVSPTRHLVKEGILMSHDPKNLDSKPQKLIVFLFNDLMVLVKPKAQKYFEKEKRQKNCFTLKAKVPLDSAKLISMSMEKTKIDNCFQMQYVPEKEDGVESKTLSLTLSAETQEAQLMWTKDIKLRIREFQKRKYLDSQRAPGSPMAGSMIMTITRSASSAVMDRRSSGVVTTTPPLARAPSDPGLPVSGTSSAIPVPVNSASAPADIPASPPQSTPPSSPLAQSGSGWGFSPSVRRKREPLGGRAGLGSSRREKAGGSLSSSNPRASN